MGGERERDRGGRRDRDGVVEKEGRERRDRDRWEERLRVREKDNPLFPACGVIRSGCKHTTSFNGALYVTVITRYSRTLALARVRSNM